MPISSNQTAGEAFQVGSLMDDFIQGKGNQTPAEGFFQGLLNAPLPSGTPLPLPGGTTLRDVGSGVGSVVNALVVDPLRDIKALGSTIIDAAALTAQAVKEQGPGAAASLFSNPTNVGALVAPIIAQQPVSDEEKYKRAERGLALIGGMLATGGVASAVQAPVGAVGAQLLQRGVSKGATTMITEIGSGIMEGMAFGSTFGSIAPLDEEGMTRSESIVFNTIGAGILGGLFKGISGYRYLTGAKSDPAIEGLVNQDVKRTFEATKNEIVLQREMGIRPTPVDPSTADELVAEVAAGITEQGVNKTGFFRKMGESVVDVIQNRWADAKKIDESTWFLGQKVAQSRITGAYTAERLAQHVLKGLTKEEEYLLTRGLIASRGRAIKNGIMDRLTRAVMTGDEQAIGIEQRNLARVNIAELSATEERAFIENPKIQEALKRYETEVQPLITEIRTRNGLMTLQDTDLPFLPLVRATPDDLIAGSPIIGPQGLRPTYPGKVGGYVRTQVTPGARRATGQGEAYIADLKVIFDRTLPREFNVDTKNDLLANIITAPWAQKVKPGVPIPKTVVVDGVEYPTKVVPLKGNPSVIGDRYGISGLKTETEKIRMIGQGAGGNLETKPPGPLLPKPVPSEAVIGPKITDPKRLLPGEVQELGLEGFGGMPGEYGQPTLGEWILPKPVANLVDELFLNPRDEKLTIGGLNAFHRFMDFNVGMLLASPVEASAHSLRILGILSRIPGVGSRFDQAIARMIPWFGPKLAGLQNIYKVYSDPAALAMEARLASIPGAIPARFAQLEFRSGVGGLAHRISPKLEAGLEAGRKFLFELPKQEKGLWGFDTRARVAAALTLDKITQAELGRAATDSEIMHFLRPFGQYTEEIQSNLVAMLRRNRVAPFGGGQAGIIPGEVRTMFGGLNLPKETIDQMSKASVAKLRAEVLWRGVVGTAVGLAVMNRALSGKWPWENEEGRTTDLDTGLRTADGRPVYVPFSLFDAGVSRALTITSARAALETFGDDSKTYGTEALRQLANTPLTYAIGAPGLSTLATLTTGRASYIGAGGDLLRVVPPQPTQALTLKERGMEALLTSNPTLEAFLGRHATENVPVPLQFINAVTPGLEIGRKPDAALSAGVRAEFARDYEVIQDRVGRAVNNFDKPREMMRYLKAESEKFPVEKQKEMYRLMLSRLQSSLRGRAISGAKARRGGG